MDANESERDEARLAVAMGFAVGALRYIAEHACELTPAQAERMLDALSAYADARRRLAPLERVPPVPATMQ
jgi:hypothetical protein